jgi:hypothetical protein
VSLICIEFDWRSLTILCLDIYFTPQTWKFFAIISENKLSVPLYIFSSSLSPINKSSLLLPYKSYELSFSFLLFCPLTVCFQNYLSLGSNVFLCLINFAIGAFYCIFHFIYCIVFISTRCLWSKVVVKTMSTCVCRWAGSWIMEMIFLKETFLWSWEYE